ncbi:5-bromo-4-chloroindolyl phosphate hydrolysis family protein [Thalassovita taeanensis]|uniref:5-bromo-4-chloroindolyl phosphate hydrolysis protein n=1 Tax=Thalassovita taeanensis TaxID=657014 RepID=A0A1H9G3A5_9RHOB|nr:5-bromo-4-chloroindolyl phosphate hydrolysis family protein [Thalassovita taeanensis]SEQ44635.1 5-bromo-4-chloroindolyl phosphate hydrolysis protein [Thalassovita taeanensis]
MAQKFGGKYSPEGESTPGAKLPDTGSFRDARRTRAGGRINLLFLAPLPLIFSAFGNGPTALALNLSALALMLLAAWLTREGLIAQEAYEARKVARRPAFPRKITGSILTGLGLGLAGYAATGGLLAPVIYLVIGTTLHQLAFGPDPLTNKGMDGIDSFQTDRVARAVTEAEKHLTAMTEAMKRAGDRQMAVRLEKFQTTARTLFRTVEEDPRDLTAARKYMSVYLMGARDATIKFADIYGRSRDAQARADYAALLDDLEQNFAARTQKLLLDDRSDLTIEIDVLRDRLKREGIRTE